MDHAFDSPGREYREALSWLFARTRGGAPRNSERMRRLVTERGLRWPAQAVQVVGSNGKGTVASMIAAGLSAAGRSCGLFVSPHVEDFRERISVRGRTIDEQEVVAFVRSVQADERMAAYGFFELTLGLALEHFARRRCSVAVFEAGIGARNDPTAAVENVVLTVLTNVALDHQALLGDTLTEIAADKLAAVRPGIPLVCGADGEAAELARAVAAGCAAPLHLAGEGGSLFDLSAEQLGGAATTVHNRRLAGAALRLLGISEPAIDRALALPPLPGRFERFVVRNRIVVLDGAHDPGAARLLRREVPDGYLLVFGALPRKQAQATFEALAPGAHAVILTAAAPAAARPEWGEALDYRSDPLAALDQALQRCPPGGTVLVSGSLYLAGRVRPYLRRHHQN